MPAQNSNIVFDALGEFSKGMNSGLSPFQLPPNQLSNAVNCTVRGNFVTNRPAYFDQVFSYAVPAIKPAVENKYFQGVCYYRPQSGSEQIVAQIGGRLFTFTPGAGTNIVAVAEISIPGDPNPETAQEAWIIQAERFLIVDDGLSVPIFYDGVSPRRSNVDSVSQGVTANTPFSSPPIGGTVDVSMSAPYTGIVGQALQLVEYDTTAAKNVIANSSYVVTAIGGSTTTTYKITLRNLTDIPGSPHASAEQLIIKNNYVGTIVSRTVNGTGVPNNGLYPFTSGIVFSTKIASNISVGNSVTIINESNDPYNWTVSAIAADRKSAVFTTFAPSNSISSPLVGTVVSKNGGASNITAGVLKGGFLAPAAGVATSTELESEFTYPNGQLLFLGNAQYQVVSSSVETGSGVTVTLLNLNDGRGSTHQFNPTSPATTFPAELFNFPELPAGRMMAYGMGRVWQSLTDGFSFIAGDIVGGSSGSPAYNYKDSVLKVSENSYLANGGSFSTPSNLGQITAMKFTAQLDASLGQGPLMVVTPGGIFSCNAPADRTLWSTVTSPIVSESLIGLGGLGQDSSIVCNGDLIFTAVDGIRSLIMARREFWSWGNTPISFEMSNVISKENRNLLSFGSSVQFDNRMLRASLPQSGNVGTFFPGLIALNFDPVSSLQGKGDSVYDGLWNGRNILKIVEGQFNGVQRCFAFTCDDLGSTIGMTELLRSGTAYLDNGTDPIEWSFESPVMFAKLESKTFFGLVNLEDGEFYVSDIQPGAMVYFKVQYRPDMSQDWFDWYDFALKNSSTTTAYGARLGLGKPVAGRSNNVNPLSSTSGRWFQVRFLIRNHCIMQYVKVSASPQDQPEFARPLPRNPPAVGNSTCNPPNVN